jgi:hypothetical protein
MAAPSLCPASGGGDPIASRRVLDAEQAFLILVPVDKVISGTLLAYDLSVRELQREAHPELTMFTTLQVASKDAASPTGGPRIEPPPVASSDPARLRRSALGTRGLPPADGPAASSRRGRRRRRPAATEHDPVPRAETLAHSPREASSCYRGETRASARIAKMNEGPRRWWISPGPERGVNSSAFANWDFGIC